MSQKRIEAIKKRLAAVDKARKEMEDKKLPHQVFAQNHWVKTALEKLYAEAEDDLIYLIDQLEKKSG